MTGQASPAQRRRTSRSTTISTANSPAIQMTTQIHSAPGIAQPLPSGAVAERDAATTATWWLPARNDLHAVLPCGDPDRLRRPRTARPFACQSGCQEPAGRVEGRCALMSARSGRRPAPRPTRPVPGPETPVARGGRGPKPDQQAAPGEGDAHERLALAHRMAPGPPPTPGPHHPRTRTPTTRTGGDRCARPGVDPLRRHDQRPRSLREAEALELGRRVAQERGYQSVLFDDPADYA
jgi:hypothetical protein